MAAKASRVYTLLLLFALSVATLTGTVMVSPVVAASGSGGPCTNGDPDRPNDAPKPTAQPQVTSVPKLSSGSSTIRAAGGERAHAPGWSWAMEYIASLLGRRGL
jgi:hypothetical protein